MKVKSTITDMSVFQFDSMKITVSEVKEALRSIDTYITYDGLDALLCRAFECDTVDNVEVIPPREVSRVLRALQSGLLKPSPPSIV